MAVCEVEGVCYQLEESKRGQCCHDASEAISQLVACADERCPFLITRPDGEDNEGGGDHEGDDEEWGENNIEGFLGGRVRRLGIRIEGGLRYLEGLNDVCVNRGTIENDEDDDDDDDSDD